MAKASDPVYPPKPKGPKVTPVANRNSKLSGAYSPQRQNGPQHVGGTHGKFMPSGKTKVFKAPSANPSIASNVNR